jgi:hypothetical protein
MWRFSIKANIILILVNEEGIKSLWLGNCSVDSQLDKQGERFSYNDASSAENNSFDLPNESQNPYAGSPQNYILPFLRY